MGVSELSRQLQLSKGAVHKLLMTLESEGFIKQNPANKQYALGYTLLELGNKVIKNHNLADFTKPFLQRLAETTQELVCLCIRDQLDAIYVEKNRFPPSDPFQCRGLPAFPPLRNLRRTGYTRFPG